MNKTLRNKLRHVVTRCRQWLEGSIEEVLQGHFGIHPDGRIEGDDRMMHLSEEDREYRVQIRAHLGHIRASGFGPDDAVGQLVREIAFTHLNRLCAFKMMEARGLIRESVSRGDKSQGFMFYLADHPEEEAHWSGGKQDVAYRHFLECLGGNLSREIRALFSPHDPANRLFPPRRVLDQVLNEINDEELKEIWNLDETIGWIYQYFTPKELRDKARKESQAPRNSYELAFRNQFYTPRYVVEFLTDNTLGRTWYEMRRGKTRLREWCRYLVRRPNEVFLGPDKELPEGPGKDETFSQEELLQQPHYIYIRPKKDPRELKILDPACGSGHFLLYCFDLLETIYEEAYDDPDLGPALKDDYPTWDELKKYVPRLILRHNLHGIDIDLRSIQIASLALWLRAQRCYREHRIEKGHRPAIKRSNIVCAEPMPGEEDLLEDFIQDLQPNLLGQLVREVFEKMKLAGEVGSLLRIEEEIRGAVEGARRQWSLLREEEQPDLFPNYLRRESRQMTLFDVSGITEEEFWNTAEEKVKEELRRYAEQATDGNLSWRLFEEDAVQGFAFVDVCRLRYDVILMNPPFGEAGKPSKPYIDKAYPRTRNDVYAAFVERGLEWLVPGGMLGAITSRTGFFLTSFQKWREEILLKEARPTVFADLGYGVLDTAMVETAAYCLEQNQ